MVVNPLWGDQKYLRVTRNKIPPFEPHLVSFSKTVFYEVNLNAQSSHSATKTHDTFDTLDCILFEIKVGNYLPYLKSLYE